MSPKLRSRVLLALTGAYFLTTPAVGQAQDVAGAYLAARSADFASDFLEAQLYMTKALAADPSHQGLMEGLMLADVAAGSVSSAIPVARRLISVGGKAQIASILMLVDRLQREDYAGVLKDLEGDRKIVGPLVDQIVQGWAHLGAGSMAQATATFDKLAQTPGLSAFGEYHKAMALAMAGDLEGADKLFSNAENGLMSLRRAVFAHVQVLSLDGRFDAAQTRLTEAFGDVAEPEIAAMREKLAKREALPFDTVRSVKDGMAEAFYLLAAILQGEAPGPQVLIHARMAEYLRPDHIDAILMSAGVLDSLGQEALAIRTYDKVPAGHSAHIAAASGKVQALYRMGRKEEALAEMKALAADQGQYLTVHLALGDLLRREKHYAEAAEAYGRGLALIKTPDERHWGIFYSRAIALEQANQFDKAIPDFRKALELNPDQADVMNYLGYSLLDRNRDIDEALSLIEKAVELSPEEGHIIDSLAWGYFLIGRYDDAAVQIERASLLMPVDPVVTDHLGDIYWAVGRQLEAKFQWRRALSFDPLEKDATRIRLKLEKGLDAVIADEGGKPLAERAAK